MLGERGDECMAECGVGHWVGSGGGGGGAELGHLLVWLPFDKGSV